MLNTQTSTSRKFSNYLVTYGLWFGTVILAVYEISLVSEIVETIYVHGVMASGRNMQVRTAYEATALAQGITVVMAILAIAIVIGGFEYHSKRVGESRSSKVLAATLGIQILILVLGLVV